MHKFQYLLMFCLAAICINGENRDVGTTACGRRLMEMISMVCAGVYNRPSKKAGGAGDVFAYGRGEQMDAAVECRNLKLLEQFNNENKRERDIAAQRAREPFPFQNRIDAYDFGHFARGRRQPTTITSECCQKSCTMQEMQMYCGSK